MLKKLIFLDCKVVFFNFGIKNFQLVFSYEKKR